MRVIREYDINDYKTKSELTRVRLLTTLTTAVRSYDQLRTIIIGRRPEIHRRCCPGAFSNRDVAGFAAAAVSSAEKILGRTSADIALCAPGLLWQPSRPATVLRDRGLQAMPAIWAGRSTISATRQRW